MAQPFERTPNHFESFLDEHSTMLYDVFKSVADLCFTGPSTNIDHSAPVEKRFRCESVDGQTDEWTLPNVFYHCLTLNFDLRP